MGKITAKQQRFVDEYLIDLNATQAAIRAGYSRKTANRIAAENLTKPVIANLIAKRQQDRSVRTKITQDRVLQEYARIAFFDPRKLFDDDGNPKNITEIDDDTAAAIAGMDVQEICESGDSQRVISRLKKYKIADKKGALDSVAKHLGMFTDKVDLKGDLNFEIKVDYGDFDNENRYSE